VDIKLGGRRKPELLEDERLASLQLGLDRLVGDWPVFGAFALCFLFRCMWCIVYRVKSPMSCFAVRHFAVWHFAVWHFADVCCAELWPFARSLSLDLSPRKSRGSFCG
jgi:hypothetical protein